MENLLNRWLVLSCQGVLLSCSLLSTLNAAEPGQLAENQARFGVIEGDVGFLPLGAKAWQVPQVGLPIEPGDHVRTAEDSRVELQLTENVLWVIEPESEVVVEHVSDRAGRVDLIEGALLGIVDTSRISTAQQWELNTPAAIVRVHGTQFALQFSLKDGSRLGVFEGQVDMEAAESAAGESLPLRVSKNQEAHVTHKSPTPTIAAFSPAMKMFEKRRSELKQRQARAEEGWSVWNPEDRAALRKKFVAAPPKPRPLHKRPLQLRGDLNQHKRAVSP